ncbi:hypothetical protein [Parvularcula sp. LCG005]|uniref:hypothetical protein n=1 Tax=Parvularcula sp. LCG005 TaxID=3078805 RepID=UPI0029437F5A|nr:hypothetical protein [Parvularcula sp. LCG005]WOI53382.1 hypothetical protein RUI03_14650 [Parvularcula sp. LCG005]
MGAASAATATLDVAFTASGFTDFVGTDTSPVDSVNGTFSVTYEESTRPGLRTVLDYSLSLMIDGYLFDETNTTLFTFGFIGDDFVARFGGNVNGTTTSSPFTNDIQIDFRQAGGSELFFRTSGLFGAFRSTNITLELGGPADAVPVPAAALLFAPALGGLVVACRRKAAIA